MKTKLPTSITNFEQARKFITSLYRNGESYHPEDSALTIINAHTDQRIFTDSEAEKLDLLFKQIYNLPGNDGRHDKLTFDPCEWLSDLESPMFLLTDKSGRGFTAKVFASHIHKHFDLQETDDNTEQTIEDFITLSEEGDKWITAALDITNIGKKYA